MHFRTLAFILLQAIIQLLLFYFVLQKPLGLKLGIVDYGQFNQSSCYTKASDEILCTTADCLFLKSIENESFEIEMFDKLEEAEFALSRSKIYAYLQLSENFSAIYTEFINNPNSVGIFALAQTTVEIHSDESSKTLKYYIQFYYYASLRSFCQDFILLCNGSERVLNSPLIIENPLYGTEQIDYCLQISHTVMTL